METRAPPGFQSVDSDACASSPSCEGPREASRPLRPTYRPAGGRELSETGEAGEAEEWVDAAGHDSPSASSNEGESDESDHAVPRQQAASGAAGGAGNAGSRHQTGGAVDRGFPNSAGFVPHSIHSEAGVERFADAPAQPLSFDDACYTHDLARPASSLPAPSASVSTVTPSTPTISQPTFAAQPGETPKADDGFCAGEAAAKALTGDHETKTRTGGHGVCAEEVAAKTPCAQQVRPAALDRGPDPVPSQVANKVSVPSKLTDQISVAPRQSALSGVSSVGTSAGNEIGGGGDAGVSVSGFARVEKNDTRVSSQDRAVRAVAGGAGTARDAAGEDDDEWM